MSYWLTEKGFQDFRDLYPTSMAELQLMDDTTEAQYVAKWLKLVHWAKRFVQGMEYINTTGALKKPKKRVEWAREQHSSLCNYYEKYFGENVVFCKVDHNIEYQSFVNSRNASFLLAYAQLYWTTFLEALDDKTERDLYDDSLNSQEVWARLNGAFDRLIELQDETPSDLNTVYTNHWETMVDTRIVSGVSLHSVSEGFSYVHDGSEGYYD